MNPLQRLYQDFTKMTVLDESLWRRDTGGHGFGNKELQYYTKSDKNLYFDELGLHIRAIKEDYEQNHYTSSKIVSRFSFQYGRIEFVAKIPTLLGTWPAVWMLGEEIKEKHNWPKCGEIDLLEAIGRMPRIAHVSLHDEEYNHVKGNHRTILLKLNDNEFHHFVYYWTKSGFACEIDGVHYDLFSAPKDRNIHNWNFDQPFFMIINLAIGGYFPGNPRDDFTSDEFIIKYLKIEGLE